MLDPSLLYYKEMQIAWLKSGRATWRALVAALGVTSIEKGSTEFNLPHWS